MSVLVADKQYSIFISDNNLNAYLELVRVKDSDLSRITLEEILSKLKESNICFGINKDLIDKSLQQFYSNSIAPPPPPIVIAHGQKLNISRLWVLNGLLILVPDMNLNV